MERRKFVIGLGALASGSAAAVGTGAFTTTEVSRSISMETAGDADAFLGIDPVEDSANADEYVEVDGDGKVTFDFTETEEGGEGLNKEASATLFDDLVRITNQGSQEVLFVVKDTIDGNPRINWYAQGIKVDGEVKDIRIQNDDRNSVNSLKPYLDDVSGKNVVRMDPGESFELGLAVGDPQFDSLPDDSAFSMFASASEDDLEEFTNPSGPLDIYDAE